MCDVLFVIPSRFAAFSEESIGTLLLATILKQQNMNVAIYRFYEAGAVSDYGRFLATASEQILEKSPKIVSFYCRCDDYLTVIQLSRILRTKQPDIKIVFGGPQADASSLETIRDIPWVDYCCSGEGETTVYPLFHALLTGGDPTGVPGLTYRDASGAVHENPRPEMLADLDASPRVDYSLVPEALLRSGAADANEAVTLDVGRGCPFSCTYCSTKLFWQRKYRLKSADRIVDEMRELNETYGFQRFSFLHDLFTGNKARVLEFCDKLVQSGLVVRWSCSSRLDTVDEEMIAAMKQSGLVSVYVGVETGSPRMQKLVKKNLKLDKALSTIALFQKYRISTTVSFIYGFPEETEQDVSATMAVAFEVLEMGVHAVQFHLCAIMHGTELFDTYREQLVFSPVQSDQTGTLGVRESTDFIMEHRSVFPFYYEYRSPLREKLAHLTAFMAICSEAFSIVRLVFPLYEKEDLLRFYEEVVQENAAFFEKKPSLPECIEARYDVLMQYIAAKHPGETADKLLALCRYEQDYRRALSAKDGTLQLESYEADIAAYRRGAALTDISSKASIVRFFRSGGKLTVSTC